MTDFTLKRDRGTKGKFRIYFNLKMHRRFEPTRSLIRIFEKKGHFFSVPFVFIVFIFV